MEREMETGSTGTDVDGARETATVDEAIYRVRSLRSALYDYDFVSLFCGSFTYTQEGPVSKNSIEGKVVLVPTVN